MSKRQTGSSNTFYGKSHTEEAKSLLRTIALARNYEPKPGFSVTVLDTATDTVIKYKSLRKASVVLKCTRTTLQNYNGKLFRDRYFITRLIKLKKGG